MARAGGVLGRLAAAMVLTLAGAAQAFEPPSWFSGTAEVALPFAATELVPGPDGTLIAVSPEAKAVALVDVATAGLVGVARLAGDPVAVAARSRQRSEPRIAVISRLDSGSYALETLVLGKPGPIGTLAIKLDGRLDGFRAPGLAYVTVAAKRKAENRQLVIWDAAPGAPSDGLFVLQPGQVHGDAPEGSAPRPDPGGWGAALGGPSRTGPSVHRQPRRQRHRRSDCRRWPLLGRPSPHRGLRPPFARGRIGDGCGGRMAKAGC